MPVQSTPVHCSLGVEFLERTVNRVWDRHRRQPFVWGKSDCAILFADTVFELTGVDPFSDGLRDYESEIGALKLLRKTGFKTVEDFTAVKFPEKALLQLGTGDLCFVNNTDLLTSPAIVLGSYLASKNQDGPILMDLSYAVRGFSYECLS